MKLTFPALLLFMQVISSGLSLQGGHQFSSYDYTHYDRSHIRHQRSKRSATNDVIHFDLTAFNRRFKVRLKEDRTVFTRNAILETANGQFTWNSSTVYTGQIEGDHTSTIYGAIDADGRFEGQIITENDTVYIEPAYRLLDGHGDSSIAYKQSEQVDRTKNRQSFCESELLMKAIAEDLKKIRQSKRAKRTKRSVPAKDETVCQLYLTADHTLSETLGYDDIMRLFAGSVQKLNHVYRQIDFNRDGTKDNLNFKIAHVKIWNSAGDRGYLLGDVYGAQKYLELFAKQNFNQFCLAFTFSYRDFEGGTLGLAWVGDSSGITGTCAKRVNIQRMGGELNLNTGMVSLLNYGRRQPLAVTQLTFVHEVAHSFGSHHDPHPTDRSECIPEGSKAISGHYLMWPKATSGLKPNHDLFSPCSLDSMKNVFPAHNGCFTAMDASVCGNGVKEEDEECDCGWEGDCSEKCCNPQRTNPQGNECKLRRSVSAQCSPSQGSCCTHACRFEPVSKVCRGNTSCTLATHCSGGDGSCPLASPINEGERCADGYVCKQGECSGSICSKYSKEICQCKSNSMKDTNLCDMCCQEPGQPETCKSTFVWSNIDDVKLRPGDPCNDYVGYCDAFLRCREVDPTGIFSALKKLITTEEGRKTLKQWLASYWWIVLLLFVVFSLTVALAVLVCARKVRYTEFNDDEDEAGNDERSAPDIAVTEEAVNSPASTLPSVYPVIPPASTSIEAALNNESEKGTFTGEKHASNKRGSVKPVETTKL